MKKKAKCVIEAHAISQWFFWAIKSSSADGTINVIGDTKKKMLDI